MRCDKDCIWIIYNRDFMMILFCKFFGHKYKMLKPEIVRPGVYDLIFQCKRCGRVREVFDYHAKSQAEQHYLFYGIPFKKETYNTILDW